MNTHGAPDRVKIVEVGPRDGLQNEPRVVDTPTKIAFINRLSATGLTAIEVTSFVHPTSIPQLADAEAVVRGITRRAGVTYSALVPNLRGLERALSVGVDAIAVFTAASETFNQRNIHCSTEGSLSRFIPVLARAKSVDIPVRGYISCALGCPYEGEIKPRQVASLAERLYAMGCAEISLGDTIGVGTPLQAQALVNTVAAVVPIERLAVHFHDTHGRALANIRACLKLGVSIIDASVAGLGGCPYAPGAPGNVATEAVVAMLEDMGIATGIDLDKLGEAGRFIKENGKWGSTTLNRSE
ncbi:MAG TPA: hydroxymethylglutaryl-CoA lyase [Gammaproteobacteria bacterium]|nr:hydroxymethylglutaryl-CoA lyase [Gammaproteobacteria bacterium]